MSFADTFELPVKRTVNGKEYSLPRLTTRDYLPWLVELTESRKVAARKAIPEMIKPMDRHGIQESIELIDCTPDHITPLVSTAHGTIRVLELAAKKAGITDQKEIDAFIDAGSVRENMMDAYRVSGLITSERFTAWFLPKPKTEEKPAESPNAGSPDAKSGA